MPRWLSRVLARVRRLAAQGKVAFTDKALEELQALDLGLDERDATELIANLKVVDFTSRLRSGQAAEWLYVFRPHIGDVALYVKLALRSVCIVVSFHQEQGDENAT